LSAAEKQSQYGQQLAAIPDFEDYGPVISSSNKPAALTESETEYVVTCVKHIFKQHVVFQVSLCKPSFRTRILLNLFHSLM